MSTDHSNSVTQYLTGLVAGDSVAIQKIWDRYFEQLVRLAQAKLHNCPKRVLDEDDVVQVAFENFFRQVQQGQFAKLSNRNDLWQILAMLVDRRATDQFRRTMTEKQGAGKVRGDSINLQSDRQAIIETARAVEPTGSDAIQFAESVEQRLAALPSDRHREIALLKLSGYNNRDIADKLETALRTVERQLKAIRDAWTSQPINPDS